MSSLLVLLSSLAAVVSTAAAAEYNETLAVQLLHFAAAAYGQTTEQPEQCVRRSTGVGSDWEIHLATVMNCDILHQPCGLLIAHSLREKHSVIAFRGTKGVIQLFNEGLQATLPKMPLLGMGNINRYFLDAHWRTWRTVEDYLRNKRFASHHVSITGHSLGGALASIAAARTAVAGLRPSSLLRLYTFGEPRVGDAQFARTLDEHVPESFRLVHNLDVVPRIPFCRKDSKGHCTTGGFYHHGTEIWYPESMEVGKKEHVICDGSPHGEDSSCSNGIKFLFTRLADYIADHRRYFGVVVGTFGENGCDAEVTGKYEKPSLVDRFLQGIKRWIPFL